MRILTDLMEAKTSTMTPQRQHELLARRHSHHEDTPSHVGAYVVDHGHFRINRGSQVSFDVMPDIRSLSPADQKDVIDRQGVNVQKLMTDVINNPQNYMIKPLGIKYASWISLPDHLRDTAFATLAVGNKQVMAARGLDDEDFYDYAAHIKQSNRHMQLATTFKGRASRAKAKANEEIKKQVASNLTGASSFKPSGKPPTVVDISPSNRGVTNPYYRGTNQWRGDPAQCPWLKNGNKKCYDTVRLALHELGYDLVDMQHSDNIQQHWKDDFYFSTTADGKTVKIFHNPTVASGFLISFGEHRAYRVNRIYSASDYNQTKKNLEMYIDEARKAGKIT